MLFTAERSQSAGENEAALVRAAQSGDRAAFGALYKLFSRMVHGVLLSHVPYTDAEDLMQDVFLRAIQQLAGLREAGAFGGWLAAIARRAAFDHRKRIRPLDALPETLAGTDRADGEAFEVLGMIRELPESYCETLTMRLVEGMTGPEIAALTGLTEASVRVNLCRGMKMLRERLERRP
jgi:RNA polymerase sigma-70 factor (ECF subfamily)